DNLNFGNPEKPEVMWQFHEAIEGISEACETLGIPVVGGNVSFYNETDGTDIHPTPVVGLLGLADPMPDNPPRLDRGEEGMEIWEIGPPATTCLAGSAVQRLAGELGGTPTPPDPDLARRVIELAAAMAHIAPVLHDISDGGTAVALSEICIASRIGASIETEHPFSEDPHRFLMVGPPGSVDLAHDIARRIGTMGGDRIVINGDAVDLSEAADVWHHAIPRALGISLGA
ncbi:MAG: AIR synthase related protein, partial [Acidimicrobiia bacterium]